VTIDPDSRDHKYEQIAGVLRARIETGEITGRLPSLTELTEEFDVSQGVASRAIRLLVAAGEVETVPGRGTFVKRETPRQ
jgi:GntR family transcriptional regulator